MRFIFVFLTLSVLLSVEASAFRQKTPCKPLQVRYGQVCVNDANYCDSLIVPLKTHQICHYTLVTSSLSGDRFNYKYGRVLPHHQRPKGNTLLEIDDERICNDESDFVGFGGGFSGAVSYVLTRLPEKVRNCVYNSYFSSASGIGLSMLRLVIGGSSFDLAPWTYSETPENDTSLPTFTKLDPRDAERNRHVKEILKIANRNDFKIISFPKSAPPWMKGNNNFVGGADSQLKAEYYQAWADYYLKYLNLMKNDGIRMWAVTTGDEPVVASFVNKFEFMGWNATDQANWIVNFLGPTIRGSPFKKVKIFVFDENREDIITYLSDMVASAPRVLSYADAIALHGHTDWQSSPTLLNQARKTYPNKPIYMTEKSFGIGPVPPPLKGVLLGSWERAENLTVELVDNLNRGVSAYVYWNFILNNLGGPNYAKNYVDSPIIANENYTAIYKQPMFYAFAHFKFILVGSRRITVKTTGIDAASIHSVAYLRPDGSIAMVLYNFSATKPITLNVIDKRRGAMQLTIEPKSINSLIY